MELLLYMYELMLLEGEIQLKRTPSIARSSENAVDPAPRSFAHLAISQSFFELNGAQGLSPPPRAALGLASPRTGMFVIVPDPYSRLDSIAVSNNKAINITLVLCMALVIVNV